MRYNRHNKIMKWGIVMKKLPIGISDYKDVKTDHYLYIDKTMFIEKLEHCEDRFVQFLRPKRFGKTLFLSMLSYYYDVSYEQAFDQLFSGTYIHAHPTREKNQYHVLTFDFSKLDMKECKTLKKAFCENIKMTCERFMRKMKVSIELDMDQNPYAILSDFLDVAATTIDRPLYIMVDECDHFSDELMSSHFHDFQNMIGKNGFIRKFYETLKIGEEKGIIQRVMVTGVTPIILDIMNIDNQIGLNISLYPDFHEMMGFNEKEIQQCMSRVEPQHVLMEDIKAKFDGYLFSKNESNHLFHPELMLRYIDENHYHYSKSSAQLEKLIVKEYHELDRLLQISEDYQRNQCIQRLVNGEQPSIFISEEFMLDSHFSIDDFYSLMFYLGFLTMSEKDVTGVSLKIPCQIMHNIFVGYFKNFIDDEIVVFR